MNFNNMVNNTDEKKELEDRRKLADQRIEKLNQREKEILCRESKDADELLLQKKEIERMLGDADANDVEIITALENKKAICNEMLKKHYEFTSELKKRFEKERQSIVEERKKIDKELAEE